MYLNVVSSGRLQTAAVDDVEGTLYKFIPSGMQNYTLICHFSTDQSHPLIHNLDYLKNESAFRDRLQQEAASFRPVGDKTMAYARRSDGSRVGKGKGKASAQLEEGPATNDLQPSEGVRVFEAYHVRLNFTFRIYLS